MLKSSITLTGHLLIKKFEADGTLVYQTEVPNLIVTAGKEFIASRMVGETYDAMNYMAIGDSSAVSALANTSLVNELGRVELSNATPTGTTTLFTALFPAGTATGNIVEAGIFNQPSTAVVKFNGATNVGSNTITYAGHGFADGDKVTYTNGGGTSIGGLTTGNTYYVIEVTSSTFKLATTYANAIANSPITLTDGVGDNHKIIYGTMLARTTFPLITKSASQAISISWVVSVG